ncbi:MAG: M1 family peptidase [Cyclobacteriaceae bacterium]
MSIRGFLSFVLACVCLLFAVGVRAQTPESEKYRFTPTRVMDLVHTKLEVSFDWEKQYLYGKATLDVTPYFFPESELELDAKGMDINTVQLLSEGQAKELTYDYDSNMLTIELDKEYERTDTLRVLIDYVARPNERVTGGSEAIKSDKGLYFINPLNEEENKPQQIWTQGETESNSVWFPTIDTPNEKCTQEMYINVQDKFTTLSNGVLESSTKNEDGIRTDHWVMDLPHSPYLFMMTIGEFAVVEDKWNDLELNYIVEPEYEEYANDIFGDTPEMLTFFTKTLGVDFPWQKYSQVVVRDYVSGAMENTSASLFGEFVQQNTRELLDNNRQDIIAHELFHQWFGDLVTTESWANLTLNEGFATYGEYLWDEYKYGQNQADYNFEITKEGYIDEAHDEPKSLVRYYYDHREDMFDQHSYNKGGWVLHMLRNYVGDEVFFAALQFYLIENSFQSVELDHLRLAFEEVSGEDLSWFFDQWFLLPGHPVLNVSHSYKNDTLYLQVEQVQNEDTHLFRLPVFVDVWVHGELEQFPLIIEEQSEQYKFPLGGKPDLVYFDAECQLLAEINHKKSAEELLFQFQNSTRYAARDEAISQAGDISNSSIKNQMISLALKDPHFDIRISALNQIAQKNVKPKKYEEALATMLDDESPFVRADVLSILTDIDFQDYSTYLFKALGDSSYYVCGAAIQMLSDSKENLTPDQVKAFEKENNINVVIALANYFSERENFPEFEWYTDKLSRIRGNELFYFIQYFSEMLLIAPDDDRKRAIGIFQDLASNHNSYIVRLSAYQALMLLGDLKGVEKKLAQIRKEESDERLLELYNNLQ